MIIAQLFLWLLLSGAAGAVLCAARRDGHGPPTRVIALQGGSA